MKKQERFSLWLVYEETEWWAIPPQADDAQLVRVA